MLAEAELPPDLLHVPDYAANGVRVLTDSAGGITVLSSNYDKETFTSGRALYATASATNCTVNVIEQ